MAVRLHKTKTTRFFRVYLPESDKREQISVEEAREMVTNGTAKIYDIDPEELSAKPKHEMKPKFKPKNSPLATDEEIDDEEETENEGESESRSRCGNEMDDYGDWNNHVRGG